MRAGGSQCPEGSPAAAGLERARTARGATQSTPISPPNWLQLCHRDTRMVPVAQRGLGLTGKPQSLGNAPCGPRSDHALDFLSFSQSFVLSIVKLMHKYVLYVIGTYQGCLKTSTPALEEKCYSLGPSGQQPLPATSAGPPERRKGLTRLGLVSLSHAGQGHGDGWRRRRLAALSVSTVWRQNFFFPEDQTSLL